MESERELGWILAMLPWMKEPIPLEKFVGRKPDETGRVKRFHEAWDKIDLALRG